MVLLDSSGNMLSLDEADRAVDLSGEADDGVEFNLDFHGLGGDDDIDDYEEEEEDEEE